MTEHWLIGTDLLPAGAAVGGAPVYAFLAESGHPAYYEGAGFGGWQRIDILWAFEPGYDRRFFVHAARLDGSGPVSFGDLTERVPVDRVELDASLGRPLGRTGSRVMGPLPMLVRESGCYGLQIDTDRGSSVSVVEVRPVEEAYAQLEARPLEGMDLDLSDGCPETPISSEAVFRDWIGGMRGDGPVYLAMGGRWVVVTDARELGPMIVRGARADGPGGLSFDAPGRSRTDILRLPIHSYIESDVDRQPPGWRQFLGGFHVPSSGCYLIQVDTLRGTQRFFVDLQPESALLFSRGGA